MYNSPYRKSLRDYFNLGDGNGNSKYTGDKHLDHDSGKFEFVKIEEESIVLKEKKKEKRRNFQFNLTLIFTSFQGLRRARMKLNSRVRSRVLNFQLALGKDSRRKRIIRCFAFRARLPVGML